MKNKTVNARIVWKQFEDILVPRLRLSVINRAVYSHLFRHSRLDGKRTLRFTIIWLARGIRLCMASARQSVRRLADLGVLRLVERTKAGHVVEVRLPREICAARPQMENNAPSERAVNLEELDFLQTNELRQAIHTRERGLCFYCLHRTDAHKQCLDHVVPRALSGRNSYRNLVSCCQECNWRKGETPAKDFLRLLLRQDRLSNAEFTDRLRALEALAAGKLKPEIRS